MASHAFSDLSPYATLALGDWPLSGGGVLCGAQLAYKTYGELNAERNNCVVFPTYYTGSHDSNARLIGHGRALDPARWFIVVPNLFGNGVSTSPSTAQPSQRGPAFPLVSVADNVRAQFHLVHNHLQVAQVALVTGWSMGAMQAYQWSVAYPDYVQALLPFCGAARCWPHNRVFIAGVSAALKADASFANGHFSAPPAAGLRAFARVYAGWAYSQAFFRDGLYRSLGHESIEDFLQAWEADHLAWNANDLLAKMATWWHADVSAGAPFNGDLAQALSSIKARTIVMPCDHDLYFTLEDNRFEAALISGAEFRPLHSPYGHCAGAPNRFAAETAFIEAAMRDLLQLS